MTTPLPEQDDPVAAYLRQYGKRATDRPQKPAAPEQPGIGERVAGALASLLTDVPGGEAAQAGAAALGSHIPGLRPDAGPVGYQEALADIRAAKAAAPAAARIPLRLLGGAAAAGVMPGSGAVQGALYGAASGLGGADYDTSRSLGENLGSRAGSAALGAGLGAAAGKLAEAGSTALRARFAGPKLDAATAELRAQARDASGPLYDAARAIGDVGETPALQRLLGQPEYLWDQAQQQAVATGRRVPGTGLGAVQNILRTIQRSNSDLADLPATDMRVLDQLYKELGGKANAAKYGDLRVTRDALKAAIEDAIGGKGGSYTAALQAFSQPMQEAEGMEAGATALGRRLGDRAPSPGTTEQSAEELARTSTNLPANVRGVLAQVRGSPLRSGFLPGKALREAPDILRLLEPQQPSILDAVRRGSLAGPNISIQDLLKALGITAGTMPARP